MRRFWPQAAAIAARDLHREWRSGEILWVTVPFGAIALLLIPLAVGADTQRLRAIGPGLFWVVVMLFGVLIAARRTATETTEQRDLVALLGVDPAADFSGRAMASGAFLIGFEVVVGLVAVVLYDIDLSLWPWLIVVLPVAATGLALLGTLTSSIAASVQAGPALIPFLVAPLSVPLLLGATQALDGIQPSGGILAWVLLMVTVDVVLAVAGIVTARPLQETH